MDGSSVGFGSFGLSLHGFDSSNGPLHRLRQLLMLLREDHSDTLGLVCVALEHEKARSEAEEGQLPSRLRQTSEPCEVVDADTEDRHPNVQVAVGEVPLSLLGLKLLPSLVCVVGVVVEVFIDVFDEVLGSSYMLIETDRESQSFDSLNLVLGTEVRHFGILRHFI